VGAREASRGGLKRGGAQRAEYDGAVIETSEVVFQGRIFRVTRDTVVEPGGVRITREIVRHPGTAVMIARRADRRILLVRQFRLGPRKLLWEVPAGRLDPGETPIEAARRELEEETGYSAARWKLLARFFPTPGYVDEKMWVFLAQGLRPGAARPEPDEVIQQVWFTLPQIREMIRSGDIEDGKTLVGYFLLRNVKT